MRFLLTMVRMRIAVGIMIFILPTIGRAQGVMGGPPIPMLQLSGARDLDSNQLSQFSGEFSTRESLSERAKFGLGLKGSSLYLGEGHELTTGLRLPDNLYEAKMSAGYEREMQSKKSWGFQGSIGSASDRAFAKMSNNEFSAIGYYQFSKTGKSHWTASLFVSNNSPLGDYIPIPGVSYFYKNETFTGLFGLPLIMINWKPRPQVGLRLSAFGPTIRSQASFGKERGLVGFARWNWLYHKYILNDRVEPRDRLTYQEKQWTVGAENTWMHFLTGSLEVGQSYDRLLYVGQGFSDRDGGRYKADGGWFVQLNFKLALGKPEPKGLQ